MPGNPRWSGYQNQVQWGRPAGAASGDSFEYEAQLLLGDDVVESKAVEIDTYLFFTNDVVTRPQEEYTIRVRARWIMIVGDPDGQYMVADVGEAEPPHEHSYTQKHDAAQHWQACSCGERLNVANHIYGDWRETKPATETEAGSRERDCTVCDYVQTETIPMLEHEHSYGDWQKDETQHWKECRCGEKTEVGNHTFGDWTITKEPIVLLPSKYLKHKADANRSPNTVRRLALSICYYLNYLDQTGTELLQVAKKSFEEQSSHFGQFLYWLVEGRHITDNRTAKTGNGTCNAYLKDVFGFFLYLADNGYTEPLRVLAYNQITVSNAVGVKRTIRSKSFKGYLKEKDRNVRAAQEPEIIDILRACTNLRDQLLLLLLAETGFRIGEILGVDYTKDIDYEKQVLKVYFRDDNDNEARAKNTEYRSAKISRETFEFLLHYLAEYRRLLQRQSLLFINIRGETAGKPMRVESVYDMLDRMEEKTGIKLTPHMLRRYYAVSRRDAGWALELIQLALGHKHLDTTVKYLGILDNQLMTASREFYEKHSDLYGIKDLL